MACVQDRLLPGDRDDPGVSRSGATIMGALLMRVDRKAATEFSFFLAIPTMLGATVYDLYKNRADLSVDDLHLIGVGFAVAFVPH